MFIPENEQGVIVLFSQLCEERGWEIVKVQTGFPDAIIRNKESRKEYYAEFEFEASNFIFHGHDPDKCDLIICWKNNIGSLLDFMPVWELSDWNDDSINCIMGMERENSRLKYKVKRLVQEVDRLNELLGYRKDDISVLTGQELEIAKFAIEGEGVLSIGLLKQVYRMSEKLGRNLLEKWESRGWLQKDPFTNNARRYTPLLVEVVGRSGQYGEAGQTGQSAVEWVKP